VTSTTTNPVEAAPGKGLLARALGVVFSPRATYADVAARPRVLGALLVVVAINVGAFAGFSSTQVGKDAMLEQVDRSMQSFGARLNDAQYAQMQARMTGPTAIYINAAGQFVTLPLAAAVVAGLVIAVFNAVMGGDASFKQVFAVVVYSGFLTALQQLFIYPIDYAKQSLTSPTSLAVFLPFLDENTFAARFLGTVDLFRIWWIVNLAIGIGVLYKKRTTPIATTMLAIYGAIAIIVAAVGVAFSGA
jgi:Yip1-like protein